MSTLLVTDDGAVRTLKFHRPDRLNAFTAEAYGTFADALTDAAADDVVLAIVLTGAERGFSSGVDLDAPRGGDSGAFQTESVRLLDALIDCPKPIVAAVHGPAVGFGATMLLHCDVVIVAHDARIRFPFTQLGTAPEAASSVLLPAAIGAQRAAEILLTSRWVSGDEAPTANADANGNSQTYRYGSVYVRYFIARNPQGEVVWIYRELARPDHWFLHGHFG